MAALQFNSPDTAIFAQLSEADWKKALSFSDRSMLTLALGLTCPDALPGWVRSRIDGNLESNAERWERVRSAYREAANAFAVDRIECAVVKGFSHWPLFVDDPRHRAQFDIDLLFPRDQVQRAQEATLRLGYEPLGGFEKHPLNHLPSMIRKTGWEWHEGDDEFGVDIPISLELHFQLWSATTEGFEAAGVEEFWERREIREFEGLKFASLAPPDQIANACLHMLRHILRGSVRPSHVYEIAYLLHHRTTDSALWNNWNTLHSDSLRRIQAICFAISERWFSCSLPDAAQAEIQALPLRTKRWIDIYAMAPLESTFHANKHEIWLHWTLLESSKARRSMLFRRLFPTRLPAATTGTHVPDAQASPAARLSQHSRHSVYVFSRVVHHARSLTATTWSAARWFLDVGLEKDYWRFVLAEGFFDFGMFVFVFLYNLYLLQLGFREDLLGLLSSVMLAGNVVGSLLAVAAMQRFGIRRMLLAAFALTAAISALRAFVTNETGLIALAAAAGLAASAWPVALSPGVTQLTNRENRSVGFSVICSAGIAIGIFGGLAAGRLPGWIAQSHWASTAVESYRISLFAGCAIILLALWPLSRISFPAPVPAERKIYRLTPFMARFLIAMAAWNLGTGVMNPFFNVFFTTQVHMPVEQIGYVFSFAQMAQVAAVLLSPLVFRKFGLPRGISAMQAATAIALLALAVSAGPLWAALAYSAYMMSQYMSEPGMFQLLMESVSPSERGGASALNFLVTFAGQAIAAAIAGALLARLGYPPVLAGAAVICLGAAILFLAMLSRKPQLPPSVE